MTMDGTTVNRSLDLILIARNLERIADHATNIAEDTIFVVSGADVRHGMRALPPSGSLKEFDK
jgi:phosphate uptake regulator